MNTSGSFFGAGEQSAIFVHDPQWSPWLAAAQVGCDPLKIKTFSFKLEDAVTECIWAREEAVGKLPFLEQNGNKMEFLFAFVERRVLLVDVITEQNLNRFYIWFHHIAFDHLL